MQIIIITIKNVHGSVTDLGVVTGALATQHVKQLAAPIPIQ